MENNSFIAIDFETATNNRMPCQIGIVKVKNGLIIEKVEYYIQPPDNKFDSSVIKVHGITPEMTKYADSFPVVWEKIKDYFKDTLIVGHSIASFDFTVINIVMKYYNMPEVKFENRQCTCKICNGKGLDVACQEYGVSLNNHHDALCDAEASANLYLKYLNNQLIPVASGDDNTENVNETKTPKKERPTKHSKKSEEDPLFVLIIDKMEQQNILANKSFLITGKTKFNRDSAHRIIKKLGGRVLKSVSGNLNIAVIGEDPGKEKVPTIDKFIKEECDIEKWNPQDFINYIDNILTSQELNQE